MPTKRILGYLVTALILVFMGRTLYINGQSLRGYDWQLNYPLLAVSVLAATGTFALYAWLWRLIVQRLGANVSYTQAFRIYFLANLGRYVPGKVWQFVGWAYLGEQAGMERAPVLTSLPVNLGLQVLTGLGLGVATLIFIRGGEMQDRYWFLLLAIPIGLVLAIQPGIMGKVLNWGLGKVGREPVKLDLRSGDMAFFALGHVGCWAVYSVAFYLFVYSVQPVPLTDLPALGASYIAAWVIGFLSFLTPSGLGIREGLLAYFLGFWLPAPVAVVIGLLSRLWVTAGELIGAAIAWRIGPPKKEPRTSRDEPGNERLATDENG